MWCSVTVVHPLQDMMFYGHQDAFLLSTFVKSDYLPCPSGKLKTIWSSSSGVIKAFWAKEQLLMQLFFAPFYVNSSNHCENPMSTILVQTSMPWAKSQITHHLHSDVWKLTEALELCLQDFWHSTAGVLVFLKTLHFTFIHLFSGDIYWGWES